MRATKQIIDIKGWQDEITPTKCDAYPCGLAIHKSLERYLGLMWTVTHIRSTRFVTTFYLKRQAIAFVNEAMKWVDWNKTEGELRNEKDLAQKVRDAQDKYRWENEL